MTTGRKIIIGDIHGCLQEFKDLVTLVSYDREKDTLISVGDLMDRGPDPVGCVRFAREMDVLAIRGNHEDQHIRYRRHEANRATSGKKNPMRSFTPIKAEQNAALSDEDAQWMGNMPLLYRLSPTMVVVHAGLEPAFTITQQSSSVARVRYVDHVGKMVGFMDGSLDQPEGTVYWSRQWRGPDSVVYGHAVHSLEAPRVDTFDGGACYGIDTGCVYGGRLTAMVLTEGKEPEFVQVQARETYYGGYHPM